MIVYRCLPLFSERSGEMTGVLQQEGTLVTDACGSCVRTDEGGISDAASWSPTLSEAWESCASRVDLIAERLRVQAEVCRTRATEEACS